MAFFHAEAVRVALRKPGTLHQPAELLAETKQLADQQFDKFWDRLAENNWRLDHINLGCQHWRADWPIELMEVGADVDL